VFWCIFEGAVAIALLIMCWSIYKGLRAEPH